MDLKPSFISLINAEAYENESLTPCLCAWGRVVR